MIGMIVSGLTKAVGGYLENKLKLKPRLLLLKQLRKARWKQTN